MTFSRRVWAILAGAVFVLLATGVYKSYFPGREGYEVLPGAVVDSTGKLTGTWKIVKIKSTNAIQPGELTGGACLVANLEQFGIPKTPDAPKCKKNSDCYTGMPGDWGGYCQADKGICWTRPGPPSSKSLCNKSPQYPGGKIWTAEAANAATYDKAGFDRFSLPADRRRQAMVQWAVAPCLNGPQPWGEVAPCGERDSSNRSEEIGKPVPLPSYWILRPADE